MKYTEINRKTAEESEYECPLTICSKAENYNLEDWLNENGSSVSGLLLKHKAILFRGFGNRDGLDTISKCMFDGLLAYSYRSTPRTNQGKNVYTATEYPSQLSIPQHCENAYQSSWPMKLLFHCVTPALEGGSTPIADLTKVTEMIESSVRREFEKRKVKYVRNYRDGVDLPWQEVFGTKNRAEVEKFCNQQSIQFEWKSDGLKTSQVCDAMAVHPLKNERVWFNQAHLFHVSALDIESQEMMLSYFKEDGLPRNAYFGDGGKIDTSILDHIREAFEENKVYFEWKKNDVLLIDNMQVSHGRDPYKGERKVLVCMAEPHS